MPRATPLVFGNGGDRVLESKFKSQFHEELKRLFPGCWILKNDTDLQQGLPDTLILWRDRWAMLEFKRKEPTKASDFEPNQEWFLEEFGQMSFAACVYPENAEEVLDALQQTFRSRRSRRT